MHNGAAEGGLPFHLYVYARLVPQSGNAVSLFDQELQAAYVAWQKAAASKRDQLGVQPDVVCREGRPGQALSDQ